MNHKVVCIGAVLIDELFYCHEQAIAATSNPATLKRTAGGVMRNIAHHLVLLGIPTTFITVAGNDADGEWLINDCQQAGIDMSAATRAECNTGKYAAILNPDGSLHAAAAANPCEAYLNTELLQQQTATLVNATMIIADTNLSEPVLAWLINFCSRQDIPLCIEPVSVSKAKKMAAIDLNGVYMLTPNEDELSSLMPKPADETTAIDQLLSGGVQHIWLTRGAKGSTMFSQNKTIHFPAVAVTVKDTTGAGDAALAAWVAAYCLGMDDINCMKAGHAMAAHTLQIDGAVATDMTREKLLTAIKRHYPDEA
jgi:pseudouridine kinase